MKVKFIAIIFVILVSFYKVLGQNIACSYLYSNSIYICRLSINNPYGFNNFTGISGSHYSGYYDTNVHTIEIVSGSFTINIPSIICNKFRNTKIINMASTGIQGLHEYSFQNCTNLLQLNLRNNSIIEIDDDTFKGSAKLQLLTLGHNPLTFVGKKPFGPLVNLEVFWLDNNNITSLKVEWFETLKTLRTLYLFENKIQELPKNVFGTLKNMTELYIYNNNLKVIRSESFSILPSLWFIDFRNNKIDAFDEKFIDNVGVSRLDLRNNTCVKSEIVDVTISRYIIRAALETCFENFNENSTTEVSTVPTPSTTSSTTTISEETTNFSSAVPSTTTTSSSECSGGFLDERVCRLENENEVLHENDKQMKKEINSMSKTIKNLKVTVDYLERKVLELSLNPCSRQ